MELITQELVSKWIPHRDKNTYKNKLGHVLCVGGNREMAGAILLSASAALHAGSGLVTVATTPENVSSVHTRAPEIMAMNMYDSSALIDMLTKVDVVVLGPGLGRDEKAKRVYETVTSHIKNHQWLIVDADGLTFFNQLKTNEQDQIKNVVITPHLGEWEMLTNIHAPASDINENAAWRKRLEAHVVLKKSETEIYFEVDIWKNTAGNPSMATGGMGDTLTGIIASFLGQFENKEQAILSAVYIHSAIADVFAEHYYVTLPTKIIDFLPVYIKSLLNEKST